MSGICIAVINNYYNYSVYWGLLYAGAGFFAIGGTLLSVGVPLYCIGNGRLNWAADSYNQRNRVSFDLTVGRYGPGLAFRF